ncbi:MULTISPECIES: hypothetical protein [unclassified Streptomyces]|uniref:hypothetical protein n=1 Tax=unclassified Streptomyces TaxID=2593676 RepID=UPI001F0E5C1B|nr:MULTISPECIES: hypothetical protein [unclassified Streptomyces]
MEKRSRRPPYAAPRATGRLAATRSARAPSSPAGTATYYVDLRATAPWLHAPQAQRSFGANVPRFSYRFHTAPLVPAKDYDGIAFVARSTCSHQLPHAEE